jgi:small subunit ribosomal protein S8
MTMTDPIADMLTRIRNANTKYLDTCDVPFSKVKHGIAKILRKEGFISGFDIRIINNHKTIRVYLKYDKDKKVRVIQQIERTSSPGRRIYAKRSEIPRVLNGLGMAIISTSNGLLTDRDARSQGLGGEVVCKVF